MFARHWHDVTRLETAGFADAAIGDVQLARSVALHKSSFFPEKDAMGEPIDYHVAVSGGMRLVPTKEALKTLSIDYQNMVDDGLFLDEVESFTDLLARCQAIQDKMNAGPHPNLK